jgi:hypothetical protein
MRFLITFFILFLSINGFALINGKPMIGAPDVVRLSFTNGWVCTGVFIDEYTILTAAHCITPTNNEETIQLAKITSADNAIVDVEQKNIFVHPQYTNQYWGKYDVGIIKTSKNKNFEGDFNIEKKDKRIIGKAMLYGCGKTDISSDIRSRTTGENEFLRIDGVLFFLGKSKNIELQDGSRVSVAPNDSGGPIVDKETGNIIGINTTTTLRQSLEYGLPTISNGTSTVTSSNLNFILKHLGE